MLTQTKLKDLTHIIDTDILSDQFIQNVLDKAYEFETGTSSTQHHRNMVIAHAFFEPSTRTDLSFQAASMRLGYKTLPFYKNIHRSSQKGESDLDSLITLSQYSDAIVLRHPDEDFIFQAQQAIDIPFINAGNGADRHPTQAILDIYCILRSQFEGKPHIKDLSGLSICLIGDLKYGRTIHSLVKLLKRFHCTIYGYSPAGLELPSNMEYMHQIEDVDEVINLVDVLYVTRLQKERMKEMNIANYVSIDRNVVENMKETGIVMHPLPRVDELSTDVDSNPRAKYFYQMKCGMYVRMALLESILA